MNSKLFMWALASSLAGLLFGFDTVVISGAEAKIQELWSLSGSMHGLAISAALWGTVLGSLIGGIPAQYPINLTWGAVGYGVLGYVLTREAPRHRPRTFVWLYRAGTALTFGLTLIASVKTGKLYQVFLQGSAPGVCLQAAGLYGFCVSRWQDRDRWPLAETVSKASFCIYLTHLFFLEFLAGRGLAAGLLPPVWAVPLLAAAAFGGGFLVWLVLRRVPVVKTYLI